MATRYTPEWIEKIVETRRKRGSYKCTEETKQKLRMVRLGKKLSDPSPILGRTYTIQHRQRIAEGHRGLELSEETKIKIANRPNPAIGERHPKAVLNDQQVREIFDLYSRGEATQMALARRHRVSRSTITKIINGYTWNHVTGLPIKGRKYKS